MQTPRYEVEAGINGCLLIRDSHSSDLTSLTKHGLEFLEQQSANQGLRRILIVSDIDGNDLACEMFYSNIQQVIRSGAVNSIIFIGNDLYSHAYMFDEMRDKMFFQTTDEFLSSPFLDSISGDAILLKIAPAFEPERIQTHLQSMAHETVLEINFDAMFHNIDYFRSKLKPETKLMCMVKASAYGSGSIEVAQALQHYGCNYLGVAFAHEGVELRKAGISLPIIVLDPVAPAMYHIIKHRLEPEIFSFSILQETMNEVRRQGMSDYPVHIKLDTGMHRSGFDTGDLPELIKILEGQQLVKVSSIMSHLASADDTDLASDTFTLSQIEMFRSNAEQIKSSLGYPIMLHTLNTAGIERFSEYQFDMVRLGIGLWGYNCENQDKLRNVCSLSTHIIQLKDVAAGETVGYNRRGAVPSPKKVALLPLGYADGIDRRLGNGKASFFINGHKVHTIGNICMDLLMVDVTGLDVKVGDKVVIFSDEQPLSDIAGMLGTITYEVLTSVSPRVRRVYYRE